jgi:DNA helicase-2/ATP-dependent DNA helicase PcrA
MLYLMPWNTNLAGTALNIAAYPGAQLRVVAGPGTGKTYALMRRVARLLEQNVQPDRVLAVSFTRTAANDLVHKLAQLGAPGADQVAAKTLHSLSFGLLSRNSVFQMLGRVPRPLMAHEQDTMVCDLAPQFDGKKAVNKLIEAFEAYWARLQHHDPGWPDTPLEQSFDHELKSWLRFHNAMLVGEVIPLALDFILQNPGHPDIPVYEHVLVDEYQDLNKADQALIDAICGNAAVTVIGDEDQSIYSFRHAHPEGIYEYPATHAGTHDELLNECRRCPQGIVAIANSLIGHNPRLAPKVLAPHAPNGQGNIYIVQHHSVAEEIQTIAEYIDWYLLQNPGVPAGEVLVLSSRRQIGNGIRDSLNAIAQQNARTWEAQSFYFEDALKPELAADGFALLTMLVDPDDAPSLRYWLGEHKQDCRRTPYRRLREHCEHSGQSPKAALQAIADGNLNIAYTGSLIPRFNDLNQRLAALAVLDIPGLIDTLFPDGNQETASIRQTALFVAPTVATVKEFLEELRAVITQPELPGSQGNSVRIMSLYKSKGLTARLVVIAGCVGGILPTVDGGEPPHEQERQRQEQRRLFYVGITRATETLVLNSSTRMPLAMAYTMRMPLLARHGADAILQASPFMAELGPSAPAVMLGVAWRQHLNF